MSDIDACHSDSLDYRVADPDVGDSNVVQAHGRCSELYRTPNINVDGGIAGTHRELPFRDQSVLSEEDHPPKRLITCVPRSNASFRKFRGHARLLALVPTTTVATIVPAAGRSLRTVRTKFIFPSSAGTAQTDAVRTAGAAAAGKRK